MLRITNKVSNLFSLVSQKISARLEYISKLKVVSLKPQTSSIGNVLLCYETGANVYDFGVILKDCSIENIKAAIQFVSNRPTEELKAMSRKAWEYARNNHTKECFAYSYRNAVLDIIKNRGTKELSTNVDKQLASAIAG